VGQETWAQAWKVRFGDRANCIDIPAPSDSTIVALHWVVRCDSELWNTASHLSIFPEDEISYNQLVQSWEVTGRSCAGRSGERLNHMDITSVAKDFEAIRLALGKESMNVSRFS
jgi:hypothetical protein